MSFTEYDYALRFRNVIRKVVNEVLELERPIDKVGRVVDVDRGAGIASVVYPGDEVNSVRVKMYPGLQPKSSDRINGTGAGSIVRVSGSAGARFISQILNEGAHQIEARLVNPVFASGGSGDTTLRQMFSFSTTQVPLADGVTWFPVVELVFPRNAGVINIYTEMTSDTDSYIQRDTLIFDSTTATGTDLPATNTDKSSSGMDVSVHFNLYDGELVGVPGATGMDVSYLREVSSTKAPEFMNVHLDCWGTGIRLSRFMDGVN